MKKRKYYSNRCLNEVAEKIQKECQKLHSQLMKGKKKVIDYDSVRKAEDYLSNLTYGIFRFEFQDKKNVNIKLIGAYKRVFMETTGTCKSVATRIKSLNHYFQQQEFENEKDPEFRERFYKYRCDREGHECLL